MKKRSKFYVDKDNEPWEDEWGEHAETQAYDTPIKEDSVGLIHYVKRKSERSEDGRWRILFQEVRTYNARTYSTDKLDGSVAFEFNNNTEYERWLAAMGLPEWAATQGNLF